MLTLVMVPDWRVGAISARCARRNLVVEEETGLWVGELTMRKLV
jgi:hypothetical protein